MRRWLITAAAGLLALTLAEVNVLGDPAPRGGGGGSRGGGGGARGGGGGARAPSGGSRGAASRPSGTRPGTSGRPSGTRPGTSSRSSTRARSPFTTRPSIAPRPKAKSPFAPSSKTTRPGTAAKRPARNPFAPRVGTSKKVSKSPFTKAGTTTRPGAAKRPPSPFTKRPGTTTKVGKKPSVTPRRPDGKRPGHLTAKPSGKKPSGKKPGQLTANQKKRLQDLAKSGKLKGDLKKRLQDYLKSGKFRGKAARDLSPAQKAALFAWIAANMGKLTQGQIDALNAVAVGTATPGQIATALGVMQQNPTMPANIQNSLIQGSIECLPTGGTGGGPVVIGGGPIIGGVPVIGGGTIVGGEPIVTGPPVVEVGPPPPDEPPPPDHPERPPVKHRWFTGCSLEVCNKTEEAVTVRVNYFAEDSKGGEGWYPADPGASDEALVFEIPPGECVRVKDQDWAIVASRVRLWAESADNTWPEFKDNDLWLVPKDSASGKLGYYATKIQTVTFTIK